MEEAQRDFEAMKKRMDGLMSAVENIKKYGEEQC